MRARARVYSHRRSSFRTLVSRRRSTESPPRRVLSRARRAARFLVARARRYNRQPREDETTSARDGAPIDFRGVSPIRPPRVSTRFDARAMYNPLRRRRRLVEAAVAENVPSALPRRAVRAWGAPQGVPELTENVYTPLSYTCEPRRKRRRNRIVV